MFKRSSTVQVLLVHPGGPFWAKKDKGAWSIPKGEYPPDEDPLAAAKREFKEETQHEPPQGAYAQLGEVSYNNKKLTVWAVEGEAIAGKIQSNMFDMEWPPKSGKVQSFVEVDKSAWFNLDTARQKLVKGQVEIIDRLQLYLGQHTADRQISLFG